MKRRLTWILPVLFCAALGALAVTRINLGQMARTLGHLSPPWAVAAFAGMGLAFICRGESWFVVLRAALPQSPIGRTAARRAILIGMATSSVAPARLGEAARSVVVSRHAGPAGATLAVVVGTVLCQTVMNGFALLLLAVIALSNAALHASRASAFVRSAAVPAAVVAVAALLLALVGRHGGRRGWLRGRAVRWVGRQARGVGAGFAIVRRPVAAAHATGAQLLGWAFQLASCSALLAALHLLHGQRLTAAAAVLVAVNVTALVPLTPSNIGVFQAACVAVLAPYGVSAAHGLAYGIALQLVEIITALVMGGVAAMHEGLSLRELRRQASGVPRERLEPSSSP